MSHQVGAPRIDSSTMRGNHRGSQPLLTTMVTLLLLCAEGEDVGVHLDRLLRLRASRSAFHLAQQKQAKR